MQNYVLDSRGPEARSDVRIDDLMPREPCIFHVQELKELQQHSPLVHCAILKTKMTILSLPESVAHEPGFMEILKLLPGLYAISVRYRLSASTAPLHCPDGDLRVLESYNQLVEKFRFADREAVNVIPEIEITGDLRLLGPTLMALAKCPPPWLVLAVQGAPTRKRIADLRHCFEYLQIRDFPLVDIHFSFENKFRESWKAQSDCFFSGPEEVHIDLSNRCTHSCVFCALYAPEIVDDLKRNNGLDEKMRRSRSAQLDETQALDLIQSLPLTTRVVQFGGIGDPMLHPKALELITQLRERAVEVEVLSNMEYFKLGDHEKLTALGGRAGSSLMFIANVSAATAETYVRTRPRQSQAVFHKVISNLRKLSELRHRNAGLGAHFTMMCVLNRFNYMEMPIYIDLAAEIDAAQVWLKPLEIHHRLHNELLPTVEERPAYVESLRLALERADQRGIRILDRSSVEYVIRSGKGESA